MENLQNLFTPSLEDLLSKIQYTTPSASKKHRKKSMLADDNNTSHRKKRNRITFDASQVDEMEKVFAENQYPDAISRDELATRIRLHEERVQIWFQNRRAKYRRELRHTYHPYEPPKEEEFPFLKKKASVSEIPPSTVDKEETPINPEESSTTAFNFLFDASAQKEEKCPPSPSTETSAAGSETEIFDQLNSEKANLLMWALSSLFNVQPEVTRS
uniref:Homeobox domain-containing protein n=2 Tax=Caenorhabditis japonica TaxID=281687 RepID=A0A8R1DTJ2_CAEJA